MNVLNSVKQGYNQVAQKLEETVNQVYEFVEPWHQVTTLMIEQRDDMIECLCPCICEGQNIYDMYATDPQGQIIKNVGNIQEVSGCGARCCLQCFRPFKLLISTDLDNDIEVTSEKPCSCPTMTPAMCLYAGPGIFCVNGLPFLRPQMLISRKNTFIGKIENPFRICGRGGELCPWDSIDIKDPNGNIRYMISASCMQTGQCLRIMCPCCRLCAGKELRFKILDVNKMEVGEITNVYAGCYKECCTKQDKFVIRFPAGANFNDKILLLHAAIAIDFDVFEDTCPKLC